MLNSQFLQLHNVKTLQFEMVQLLEEVRQDHSLESRPRVLDKLGPKQT